MHRFATYFSVIFLLLSLTMLFSIIYFDLPLILSGNKIVLFAFINSVILVCVSLFLISFKDRIILYWQNYNREKQI
jgi:hypothetical protein